MRVFASGLSNVNVRVRKVGALDARSPNVDVKAEDGGSARCRVTNVEERKVVDGVPLQRHPLIDDGTMMEQRRRTHFPLLSRVYMRKLRDRERDVLVSKRCGIFKNGLQIRSQRPQTPPPRTHTLPEEKKKDTFPSSL